MRGAFGVAGGSGGNERGRRGRVTLATGRRRKQAWLEADSGEAKASRAPTAPRRVLCEHAERRSAWWPARSSKPVLGGSPVQGGFDPHAAPPSFLRGASATQGQPVRPFADLAS